MDQPLRLAVLERLVSFHLDSTALRRISPSRPIGEHRRYMRAFRLFMPLFALTLAASVLGQSQFTRIYGPEDQDVPLPQFVSVTGAKNPTALQAIQSFLTAVNATTWPGIQATGTFASGGNQQATPEAATLTISGGDDFRLDISTPNGTTSIRIHGQYEEVETPDGKKRSFPF